LSIYVVTSGSVIELNYLNIIIFSFAKCLRENCFTFNLPNITVILRRNIPFKIPPAEVELTSASKFEEVHSNNFEKAMGGACISFTSLITGLNKRKNNFENWCIGKEL